MRLYELFDSSDVDTSAGAALFKAETTFSDGSELDLTCRKTHGVWNIDFTVDGNVGLTASGIQFEVFGAVMGALRQFMDHYKPDMITFSSEGDSRTSLYGKFVSKYCKGMTELKSVHASKTEFFLYREEPKVEVLNLDNRTRYQFPLFDELLAVNLDKEGVIVYVSPFMYSYLEYGDVKTKTLLHRLLGQIKANAVPGGSEYDELASYIG